MKNTIRIALITIFCFLIYQLLQDEYFSDIRRSINALISILPLSHFITYVIVGVPIFIGVLVIHGYKNFLKSLGLNGSLIKGVEFSLICTLPMLVGYYICFEFDGKVTVTRILTGAVIAGFIEELYYRGFLFGQIFRYTKIGFIPAVVLGALIFATGHLYQSQEFSTLVGIFMTTFMGAILFAWVYVEWQYNLWIPVFLHLFMNLFWMLFSVSDNAFGNLYGNIFRIITITLIIVLTIIYKKKRGLEFLVNKKTMWFDQNRS